MNEALQRMRHALCLGPNSSIAGRGDVCVRVRVLGMTAPASGVLHVCVSCRT